MALETVDTLKDLVPTNPTPTDPASQGDDHIRNIKKALKNTFPQITGPVTATQAQINAASSGFSSLSSRVSTAEGLIAALGSAGVDLESSIGSIQDTKADKTTKVTAGDGLNGSGTLGSDLTLSLDSSVIRTTGNQTKAGNLSVEGVSATKATNPEFRGVTSDGNTSYRLVGYPNGDTQLISNDANGANPKNFSFNGSSGVFTAPALAGDGSRLKNLPNPTVKVNTGSGLTGGAALTSDITIGLDSTVIRTTGNQTKTGNLTVGNISGVTGDSSEFRSLKADGTLNYRLVGTSTGAHIRAYGSSNSEYKDFIFNGVSGDLIAPSFRGTGTNLTNLNASNVTLGTLSESVIPASILRATRQVTTGSGLTGGGPLTANLTLSVDSTVARTTTSVSAGNGLTGGGTLATTRSLALGTPSDITAASTNEVTATSHTHRITPEGFQGMLTTLVPVNAIGQFVFASPRGTGGGVWEELGVGAIKPGSLLRAGSIRPSNYDLATTGVVGSWRLLGHIYNTSAVSLWQRIS